MNSILSKNWLNPIVSILRLCSIIEYGGSHFLIVLVALLNCCPCLLDILKSKRWTLVTGKRSERNADPFIANCLNQDSNSSCFFWNLFCILKLHAALQRVVAGLVILARNPGRYAQLYMPQLPPQKLSTHATMIKLLLYWCLWQYNSHQIPGSHAGIAMAYRFSFSNYADVK